VQVYLLNATVNIQRPYSLQGGTLDIFFIHCDWIRTE